MAISADRTEWKLVSHWNFKIITRAFCVWMFACLFGLRRMLTRQLCVFVYVIVALWGSLVALLGIMLKTYRHMFLRFLCFGGVVILSWMKLFDDVWSVALWIEKERIQEGRFEILRGFFLLLLLLFCKGHLRGFNFGTSKLGPYNWGNRGLVEVVGVDEIDWDLLGYLWNF